MRENGRVQVRGRRLARSPSLPRALELLSRLLLICRSPLPRVDSVLREEMRSGPLRLLGGLGGRSP